MKRKIALIFFLIASLQCMYGQQVELAVKTGHVESIRSLTFSPDGRYLATVGDDRTVRVWDIQSGQELRAFGGHHTAITAVAFSPSNQLLATVSHAEGLVKVWNIKTAKELWTADIGGKQDPISGDQHHTIAFSPDGTYLAVGKSSDNSSMELPRPISDVEPPPPAPPIPPRQRTGESDEDYQKRYQEIKDKAAEEYRKGLEEQEKAEQEKILLEHSIEIWNVESGKKVKELIGHTRGVPFVFFSSDGKTVISGSDDRTIKSWDFETGKERKRLAGNAENLEYVALSQSDRFLACLIQGKELPPNNGVMKRENNEIRIWDLQTEQELLPIKVENSGILKFSPDNERILLNISRGRIDYLNIETSGNISTTMQFYNQWVTEEELKILQERELELIKTKREEQRTEKPIPIYATIAVAFDSGGQLFAFSDWQNIYIWNWQTKKLISKLDSKILPPGEVILSPDGKVLAVEEEGYNLTLLNMRSGTMLKNLSSSSANLAFSPDSKIIAVCDENWIEVAGIPKKPRSSIKLFDAQTGSLVKTFESVTGGIAKFAFSPNGKLIAAQGRYNNPNALSIWGIESGKPVKNLPANYPNIEYPGLITFSGDGKQLLFSDEGKLKFWDFEANVVGIKSPHGYPDRMVLSKDGRWEVITENKSKIMLITNLATGYGEFVLRDNPTVVRALLKLVPEYYQNNEEDVVSPDGKWRIIKTADGKIRFLDLNSGKPMADFIDLGDNWLGAARHWLVTTPDGFFDGEPQAWKQLFWRFDNNTFENGAVELYFNDFFYPNLLQAVLAGKAPQPKPGRTLAGIDRRQPKVDLASINGQDRSTLSLQSNARLSTSNRKATVTIEVADNTDKKRQSEHQTTSGAQDLRLFRNGSLVKVWSGDVFQLSQQDGCQQFAPINTNAARRVRCQAEVQLIAGNNNLLAYAFNSSDVKSNDDTVTIKGEETLKRAGTLYVMAIGIGQYENPQYNLNYTVADAQAFGTELKAYQEQVHNYEQVKVVWLINEQAKKANILTELKRLRGTVQPEDAVIVYFSGHGMAQDEHFYLIPHDLGYLGSRQRVSKAKLKEILIHSISDRELEEVFRGIDSGQLLMIIDACYSGQALQADDWRSGPMNTKGLAQLAYEKGMYILTASQSDELAYESQALKHSYLTYVLVEEGLKKGDADRVPKDGRILLREWFDYATYGVPRLWREHMAQKARQQGKQLDLIEVIEADRVQQPRVFYRREPDAQPFVIANTGGVTNK